MRSLELFTGAGGLALGIHRAQFQHVAVVEHNASACDTLRLNVARHPTTGVAWPIIQADVTQFDYSPYRARPHQSSIDLLAGGAPCQPFSLGGKHAGQNDRRNMFPEVVRAVRELRPRAVLLENVRGLLRADFRPYFEYLLDQLRFPFELPLAHEGWEAHAERLARLRLRPNSVAEDERYDVSFRLYDMADFGIPQQRHRVFIVAFNSSLGMRWAFPEPTHSQAALLYAQYVDGAYWDQHGLLPPPVPDKLRATIARLRSYSKPIEEPWRTVRDALRSHKPLPEPIDYQEHPCFNGHAGIPGARSYSGHTGSPWDWPAKAIKAGDHGNPGGENMLRRDDGTVRYFTVRELARLQTFPDTWHFNATWTESRRQIGNAVPVEIAELLARLIHTKLQGSNSAQATTLSPDLVMAK